MNTYEQMREALEKLLDVLYNMGVDENTLSIAIKSPNCHMNSEHTLSVLKEARAALALPRRNCDVGTVLEQRERQRHYCGQHYSACDVDMECCRCPLWKEASCELAWAQMPYTAEGEAIR